MGCTFRSWMLLVLVTVIWTTTASKLYLNQWAVYISGGKQAADRVAKKNGYTNRGQIGSLENYYLFEHHRVAKRSVSAARHHHNLLRRDPEVNWIEQQVARKRVKRDHIPTQSTVWRPNWEDPGWQKMWYLQGGAAGQYDMNLMGAWQKGYTGKGVVVTILDDGIERTHSDLQENYDPLASDDINDDDGDPMPRYDSTDENRHGTRCAGEVAAVANNSKCGVGIAYHAGIGGVRMLDGDVSDAVEARALSLRPQHIDIYSASWGPDDNGRVVDGPAPLARAAFVKGILQGRGGRGSIFVWASGNGGSHSDSCSCDGYANSIFTLSVSSTSERGLKPWYLEECSSTLASTYSSGESYREKKIITTDLHDRCTDAHTGTSASAPIAAALCALTLQANKEITWRDMQYIVLMAARTDPLQDGEWVTNGLGRKVSHRYGYGLMDAAAMVDLAERWTSVPDQHVCMSEVSMLHTEIGMGGGSYQLTTDGCQSSESVAVRHLEHVQARVSLWSERRGDLQLHLVSPSGTRCTLLPRRKNDVDRESFDAWPFMSVFFWGENPLGSWKLVVENMDGNYGVLKSWQLVMYGTAKPPVKLRPLPDQNKTDEASGQEEEEDTWWIDEESSCHSQCVAEKGCTGSGAADCIECRSVWVDGDSVCAAVCPDSHYLDAGGGTCWPCTEPCSTCKGPSRTEDCLSCREDFYLLEDEGACVSECAYGYYADGADRWCRPCADGCLECEGEANLCRSCQIGYKLQHNRCVLHCASDHFRDPHGSCEPCDVSCRTCVGPNPTDCVLCPGGAVYEGGVCVTVCSSGFHQRMTDEGLECESCHLSCVECDGPLPDNCLSCRDSHRLVNGECQEICPTPSMYEVADGECKPCSIDCVTCQGPTSHDCLSCTPDRYLDGGECVARCSDTFYGVSSKQADGEVVRVCHPCHASCLTCRGRLSTDCTYCAPGLYLDDGACRTECREGKYNEDGECHRCPGVGCLRCHPGTSHSVICVACSPDHVLLHGRCLSDGCPLGRYPHQGRCPRCHVSCATCRGGGAENCITCQQDYVEKNNVCVKNSSSVESVCSPGEYWHQQDQLCLTCHAHCDTCRDGMPDSCLSCLSPYQLDRDSGECVACCSQAVTHDCCHCHPNTGICYRGSVFTYRPLEVMPTAASSIATSPKARWTAAALGVCLTVFIVGGLLRVARGNRSVRGHYRPVPILYRTQNGKATDSHVSEERDNISTSCGDTTISSVA